MASLREDDVYKASTQYRLWSFSPETLASSRNTTNHTATVRVVAALRKSSQSHTQRISKAATHRSHDEEDETQSDSERLNIETLTTAEEQILLRHYTRLMIQNVCDDKFALPALVTATAAQYLKRFYIQNSVMTYHPKSIFPTCLYLAMKNCHQHMSLSRFTNQLGTGQTAEDILAPEFLICQGLRFCFDIRWPGRGLRGGLMELLEMSRGKEALGGRKTQQQMLELNSVELDMTDEVRAQRAQKIRDIGEKYEVYLLDKRCTAAYESASGILGESALLTDVYLLYTPSQIWLAAIWLADAPLTEFFLFRKFCPSSTGKPLHTMLDKQYSRVLSTVKSCAKILSAYDTDSAEKKELVRIDKKLYGCLNPEKQDLRKLRNTQKKRNGGDDVVDEKAAKKRRLERERIVKDGDIFGPQLNLTANSAE